MNLTFCSPTCPEVAGSFNLHICKVCMSTCVSSICFCNQLKLYRSVNHSLLSLLSWNNVLCTCTHKIYSHWPVAHTQPTVILHSDGKRIEIANETAALPGKSAPSNWVNCGRLLHVLQHLSHMQRVQWSLKSIL